MAPPPEAALAAALGPTRLALTHDWRCYKVFKQPFFPSSAQSQSLLLSSLPRGSVSLPGLGVVLVPSQHHKQEPQKQQIARSQLLSPPEIAAKAHTEALWELLAPRVRVAALTKYLARKHLDDGTQSGSAASSLSPDWFSLKRKQANAVTKHSVSIGGLEYHPYAAMPIPYPLTKSGDATADKLAAAANADAGLSELIAAAMADAALSGGVNSCNDGNAPVDELDSALHAGHYLILDAVDSLFTSSSLFTSPKSCKVGDKTAFLYNLVVDSLGTGDALGIAHDSSLVRARLTLAEADTLAGTAGESDNSVSVEEDSPSPTESSQDSCYAVWPFTFTAQGTDAVPTVAPGRVFYPSLALAVARLGAPAAALLLRGLALLTALPAPPKGEWLTVDVHGLRGAFAAHAAAVCALTWRKLSQPQLLECGGQWDGLWDDVASWRLDFGAVKARSQTETELLQCELKWREVSVESFTLAADAARTGGGMEKARAFDREIALQTRWIADAKDKQRRAQ